MLQGIQPDVVGNISGLEQNEGKEGTRELQQQKIL
jgi:hypothetical protein